MGKHGETLVIDWGLAKAVGRTDHESASDEQPLLPASASGSAETLPGSALGTPAYMSPEQAAGDLERLGPRSDVYGLGATLYCLLAGRCPFAQGDVLAVLRAVQKGDFPPPSRHNPSLDRALEAVCLQAMALDPADRYATPRALAEDIERWAADEPVSAYLDPWAVRAARWGRRHRTLVSSTAALLLTAVVALLGIAALLEKSRADLKAEKSRTEDEKQRAVRAAAEAGSINRFFHEYVLAAPRPAGLEGGVGKDITMREAIDLAVPRVAAAFLGQPGIEADVRTTLGDTYYALGRYTEATSQLEAALSLRSGVLGPDHPDTLRAQNSLALALEYCEKFDDAESLYRRTLDARG